VSLRPSALLPLIAALIGVGAPMPVLRGRGEKSAPPDTAASDARDLEAARLKRERRAAKRAAEKGGAT
jgi:hypothetical protein